MISALFLSQDENYYDFPSSRIRILNLLPHLKQEGIAATVEPFPRTVRKKISCIRALANYDVVILQKKLVTWLDLQWLRQFSKKIIFDFDDAIYQRMNGKSNTRSGRFRSIMQSVDLAMAGNEVLEMEAKKYGANTAVIPSAVPVTGIAIRQPFTRARPFRVGWIGTQCNLRYLHLLEKTFVDLSKKYEIELHVICDASFSVPGVKTIYKPWSLTTQQEDLAALDIGVMPLPNNRWTAGKCGYKSLQYMASAVVPICSDVGKNAAAIEDGKNGFVVSEIKGFSPILDTLLQSPSLIDKMGAQARKKVMTEYSVEAVSKRVAKAIKATVEDC